MGEVREILAHSREKFPVARIVAPKIKKKSRALGWSELPVNGGEGAPSHIRVP